MSIHTPKTRPTGLQRPSYSSSINGASPGNPANNFSASTAVNRKASLQALTASVTAAPRTPAANSMGGETLTVGDAVNVPGEMFGTVKFIGSVRGKAGRFVGVELDAAFAARGKNDGDVDGVYYFNTALPGAGIFLPVARAEKRFSPSSLAQNSPETEPSPTPLPSITPQHRFAQTVGPGARPPSPQFKPKRPSLPRPESPFRKQPPNLAPTPGRTLSQSTRGVNPSLGASIGPGGRPGATPSKNNFKASTSGMRPPATGGASQTPRPYSRSGSRLGNRNDGALEEERTIGAAVTSNSRTTSQGSIPSFSQPLRSPSRLGSAGGGQDQEVARLKSQLQERDRRLEEQAASLAEMEQSVKELSTIIPSDDMGSPNGKTRSIGSVGGDEDASAAQLRQMLREKNEKISLLTAEFDAHRADFRSTLDSLEMASTETERVYEEQKRDLLQQLGELQEVKESKEDFEGITTQLKQLEELVAELEEGLEESRRGEAEARGEVEFLRGEVERGRSELKREREKAAAAVNGNGGASSKELEQKDDEIRGLKVIIHGLSSNPASPAAGAGASANGVLSDAGEVKKLQVALDEAQSEKEGLERELEQLRRDAAAANGASHVRNESEKTATASESKPLPARSRSNTIKAAQATRTLDAPLPPAPPAAPNGDTTVSGGVFCEMCEASSHDTLDCAKLQGGKTTYSPGKENEKVNGKFVGGEEEDKWCALCEKDGHLAFDCPEEQY